jgi:hypothetical protein
LADCKRPYRDPFKDIQGYKAGRFHDWAQSILKTLDDHLIVHAPLSECTFEFSNRQDGAEVLTITFVGRPRRGLVVVRPTEHPKESENHA